VFLGHSWQLTLPFCAVYVPAGQSGQNAAPGSLADAPAAHGIHMVELVCVLYEPAAQSVHVVAAVTFEKAPLAHGVQLGL
jgi:hypothetical protein